MHDYLFSSEIVRFAFVFGICVSMMLYERLHLTTGSIVVPGYIAMFLVYPMVVVATFVNALALLLPDEPRVCASASCSTAAPSSR